MLRITKAIKALLLTILVSIYFSNCSPSMQGITNQDVKEVINFFMNQIVDSATHENNYLLSPIFEDGINNELINALKTQEDIKGGDVKFMLANHAKYKGAKLIEFIDTKHISKLQYEEPENNEIYYVIDPPLFTCDKETIFIYARTIFKVNVNNKWDHLFFVIHKCDSGYEFIETIRITGN